MDWKQLIADIGAYGLSQPQIASICVCGQATISDLASGKTKDPRDSLGQALRALLAKAKAGELPELIGAEGAPDVAEPEARAA